MSKLYFISGIPEKWDPGPDTLHLGPFTWNPQPETHRWDPGSRPLRGTWDLGPYTWEPLPEILYVGDLGQRKKSHFVYLPQVGFI